MPHRHTAPSSARRPPGRRLSWLVACAAAPLLLSACDIPGLGPDPRTVQKEAEAKAIGGACRHALRGLEDCFTLNPKASKAQVFAGWKEMDQYMRENKLEGAPSVLGNLEKPPTTPARRAEEGRAEETREGGSGRSRS
ncbi:hypothetical protein QRO11_14130 [Paracidovorax citrulli]|uniref:hypothetical protein n=1 Tax=Paracidovorax citrulli TaxID=80869 RepID=UPI00061A51A6|nr:hypothetical protein [Paracidovorax citrulli]QCX12398.1 hypothetical protein APS58_3670 [Paracidovorax citrulli]UEG44621.1 hypothetical protein LKW27_13190 [Paracidovorax citrulli]UMT88008.1 hypothetical protein FRC90_07960 [Paracidovorax citrulli]UMT97290.1 hypothetical protein FRC97_21175 [Paracidovorax citrulli]WIY33102.1 hypothetical protein QRO11_14130 [Paracidovorax citrulli]